MRCTVALTLATGLISLTDGLQLAKRTDSAPKVFGAEIQRRHVSNPIERDQARRRRKRDSLQETLDNLETLYFANASLGTPAQSLRLHLDTGSSDLWVNTDDSDLCSSSQNDCSSSGTYSANDSSTYEYVNSLFNISYVDGSGASGDYVKDTFTFGGQNLTDMQFGIGYTSTSSEGVLGIGYTKNEVAVNRAGLAAYPNLPQLLVNKGIIQSNAYSLWLNDLDASKGNILFGGVDTEKYHGSLSTLPILQEASQYRELIIALTGIGSNGNTGTYLNSNTSSTDAVPVLLDSGSSLTYLPDDVVTSIYNDFDAVYDENEGAAFIDCDAATSSDSLEFTFSSPTISVPMNELVLLAGYSKGQAVCILGISPAGDSTAVLGDTFLRSAYVVYDLANNEISLAQTNYNATDSNIEEITTGTASVPDATGVANAVSAIVVATGGARNGGLDVSDNAAMPMKTAMPVAPIAAAAAAGLLFAL
ncbi:aspartic-type endopeptidase [Diplodia corticola]|uniref:Probable aspartic-type endopeptidase OPSB n=1 Tax=Diplodia corticola TaxID=236234 RepID=A0A1J9QJZ9_9PEZI|nr:aspartic-type endopeptidase [Diplodia corticola]OJD29198.1 aspartic-type endopeptidase [Diplodia corticola]